MALGGPAPGTDRFQPLRKALTTMIAAIIQARIGSTRFPNKIFTDLAGKPVIWHIVNRLTYSRSVDRIIIATTVNPLDDKVEQWAKENSIRVYRGPEDDVLARYYGAAVHFGAETIVRITSDDPFKDPEVMDAVITRFLENRLDFAYNNHPATFPEGLDIEVFSFAALKAAQENSRDAYEREHVTQHFYRNPDQFRQMNLRQAEDLSYLRWTLDTEKDYEMIRTVYDSLYKENSIFLMKDILAFLEKNPGVSSINSDVKRSDMYQNKKP
jgi:spore coat polysaccharide biosynthesis protein SpsF